MNMINKSLLRIILLIVVTLAAAWAIPALTKKAASSRQRYPFVNYSEIIEQFCYRDVDGKNSVLSDASGKIYTDTEFDSIQPMLYYRQLSAEGKMPDSIRGQEVTMPLIRQKSFTYRYNPNETSRPNLGLYILYEVLPKRLNLESPHDVFRLKENIEFIDVATNKVNREKSDLFTAELLKRGYSFPAQWTEGILTIRKPYDEGYFTLDAEGKLFHLKMVNGRPFVRDTGVGEQIDVAHFSMLSVADKRFYGFVYDTGGSAYILEAPGYNLLKLDMPPLDMGRDNMMILANMFFWTVTVTSPEGRHTYALHNDNLERADETFTAADKDAWDSVSKWLFPAYLTVTDSASKYVKPRLHFTALNALALNLLLALVWLVIAGRRGKAYRTTTPGIIARASTAESLYILITGVAGLIALIIIPSR